MLAAVIARALAVALIAASLPALGCAPATTASAPATVATMSPQPQEGVLPTDRPVVIVVTATWCASCRATAPAIAWLREEYGDRVTFVDLDLSDDAATSRSAAEADRLGVRWFFESNDARTGVTILGSARRIIRRSMVERRPGPFRQAFAEAFASFSGTTVPPR
jgi:thiol-disulfide isomerase/thioredoxin